MTTEDFLNKYDLKKTFTEEELYRLYIGDVDIEVEDIDKGTGEQNRWDHIEWRVIKIKDRYFEIARLAGNTEYQPDEYNCQPIEVKPVEKTIITWEEIYSNGTI